MTTHNNRNVTIKSINKSTSAAFDFQGFCDSRATYWKRLVGIFAVFAVTFVVSGIFASTFQSNFVTMTAGLTIFLAGLGAAAAVIILIVQRLRSLDAHWAFVFLLFIPPLAAIMLVALGVVTQTAEPVKHTKPRTTKTTT